MEKKRKGLYEKYFKRMLDFLLSLLAIIILSPVYIILAICVRIRLGSPILFRQSRPGRNEKIFMMYKFRTMTNETDANGDLLPDEERTTKLGLLLRALSLDELPELFNVLKGDMSLIGPRPLLEKYIPYYNDEEKKRHNVRPGLTGLAQINGRNFLMWDDRLKLDVEYVDNITFLGDLNIFIKTIGKVIKRSDVSEKRIIPFDEYRRGISMENISHSR